MKTIINEDATQYENNEAYTIRKYRQLEIQRSVKSVKWVIK